MSEQNPETPGRSDAELADQLRAGVAVIAAAHQLHAGQLDNVEFGRLVAGIGRDHFPEAPVQLVLPVSWLALKLAALVAELTGQDLATVMQWLGAEAADSLK
ncbi:hypothetical protein [Nonomuraea sp. LPB2021202275-12-8]|uniref:hypothetical protein n=1 Tax=Nonomuraea sp. LPB2021202275-12-8 TaxID=3120159 RepID=UPI00300CDF55